MDVEVYQPRGVHRIRLQDQSRIKARLLDWAEEYEVRFASLQVIGQLRFADVVSGYRKNRPDAKKISREFTSNRHLLASGTLINETETQEVHLHGALGRGQRSVVGCLAGDPEAFRGVEILATVLERNDMS